MLPRRLILRNFLAYRAPDPVVFDGLHLAVLSGPNGAGKSSLLDAITWALWGKARARSDQDLITLGADEMSVELDFEHEGGRYRVARQRDAKRRQGRLSLFIWDEEVSGGYNEITAPSMRETQARINTLLRLDYETFVHSAFLQQGKADAFTAATPAERKQTLADILGLDAWQGYENRAKARLREITEALRNIEGRLAEIEEALGRRPVLERDAQEAETAYNETESALRQAETHYAQIADAPAQLQAASARQEDLRRRLREYDEEERTLQGDLARQQERIASYQVTIDQQDSIEIGYAELEAARSADQDLGERLLHLREAETRRHALQTQINEARAALETEAGEYRSAIAELERLTADAAQVEADITGVEGEIAALESQEQEHDHLRDDIARFNEESAVLRSANAALRAEMNALKARLDTLQAAHPDSAVCPTCQQPLSPQQRIDLIDDYRQQGTARGDQFRANDVRLRELHSAVQAHQERSSALTPELRRLDPLRERRGQLVARREAAREAESRLTGARAALEAVEAALNAEAFAQEARAQLAALEADIAALAYDRDAHEAARQSLKSFREYERRQQELSLARDSLPEAAKALDATRKRLARLARARKEDEAALQAAEREVARLQELVREANHRADEVRARRTALQAAAERRAAARQALAALEGQRDRREALLKRREDALNQQDVYTQLRQAFGKSGIPAMIIEAAIPELEDDANALLARMTDGRMQVRFSTQRETVKGDVIETLAIEIADELGARDYALYSGGEAFRVNFAVRIALSRLLSRRAGAHLRTLFIDEGFGTQDAVGRERLVEAINAIADDFDLILVITHIDDLRDAFPARLEVTKTPSGSLVRLA